jgi:hypothetical protein
MMRFLRGVTGRVLACGCLVGVYETYGGDIVATIDARGAECRHPGHALHAKVPAGPAAETGRTPERELDRTASRS